MRNTSFIKRNTALIFTLAFALSAVGCTSNTTPVSPDPENENVTETVTEISEVRITEPVVTRTNISDIRTRNEPVSYDLYSTVNDFSSAYEVKDGYYEINFLKDKEFQKKINDDIRFAMDSLKKFQSPEYTELASRSHSAEVMKTGGIVADIICRNGFLSVLLEYGYVEPFSKTQAGAYSVLLSDSDVQFDHAVTLNYELFSQTRVTDFSELFYSDSDWNSSVPAAEDRIYNNSVSYYPDKKPDMFTLDYIIYATEEGMATARYNTYNLNLSLCRDMISSFYRDMSEVCENTSDVRYDMFTESSLRTCDSCGQDYMYRQIDTSRFYSDDEIVSFNSELDKLYEHGFPGRQNHECFTYRTKMDTIIHYTPDQNMKNIGFNLWGCSDREGCTVYYDPDTYERLNVSAILGTDWKNYIVSPDTGSLPDLSNANPEYFVKLQYVSSENTVKAEISADTESGNINISVIIPSENVNQNYLSL